MTFSQLAENEMITIQAHDNPDADAIGSGYALYVYFHHIGKKVRFIYSGRYRINKANLKLLVEELHIPIEYVPPSNTKIKGLLITVDCQYGAGNVTFFPADCVAVIDHHQVEENLESVIYSEIRPALGSCATLVWKLLKQEQFSIESCKSVGTALYYGLYSDTNQFAEVGHPQDLDMRDDIIYDKNIVNMLRYSNLSLEELEIAGIALKRYIYNEKHQYAIIQSQPCDPNILGLISDFLIQVDKIHTCIVYNISSEGMKFSVRSCVREVKANELAQYLAYEVGTGGGHIDKAGGFINMRRYEEKWQEMRIDNFFGTRMDSYFDSFEIIIPETYTVDLDSMDLYEKQIIRMGYVKTTDILPEGTLITVRTLEGDADMLIEPDRYIMVGIKGEVYPTTVSKFTKRYRILEEPYHEELEYTPKVRNKMTGQNLQLLDFVKACESISKSTVYAKKLTKAVKIFTRMYEESYMLGKPGDYLVAKKEDLHDIYIVENDIFHRTYDRI